MAEDTKRTGPGTDDTTEYSPSKAPDTKKHAEEKETVVDLRLIPGGRRPASAEPGMAGLDRDTVPSAATNTDAYDYGVADDTPGHER